jgi:hypothetical protein
VAFLYLVTALYAVLVIIFDFNLLLITESGTRLTIMYPFTSKPFLLAENTGEYITQMVLGIGFYGLFLLLLSNVFLSFSREKLFTTQNIRNLQWFYRANLTLPITVFFLLSLFSQAEDEMMIIVVLHGILGVFAFFMAAIFKQGVNLQNEQDLYI